jgi:hypothetical protein
MAVSQTTATATAVETSGIFAEAVGGIATIVLTIIALSGTSAEFLLAVATIVFGAALLIEGTSITTDYVGVSPSANLQANTGGLAAIFLAGITGIILGVLGLLGINAIALISVAVIVYGSALLLSSSTMLSLRSLKADSGEEVMASGAISGTVGAQALAAIAAIVLGILAVAGAAAQTQTLTLVALLVLGAAILTTGNGANNALMAAFRMPRR